MLVEWAAYSDAVSVLIQSESPTLRILHTKPFLLGHLQALIYKVWVPFTLQPAMYCLKNLSKIQKEIQLNIGDEFAKRAE